MVYDPTITQRVRSALIDAGHPDLAIETISAGMREIETELARLKRDVKILQDAERDRLTQTGAWTFVKAKLDRESVNWMKWGIRATLAAVAALLLKLAWKGLHI